MAARAVKTCWFADGQLEVSIAGESSHASVADQAGRPTASFKISYEIDKDSIDLTIPRSPLTSVNKTFDSLWSIVYCRFAD
jgi:hypothetical protein